jgi:uncharacterized protein
MPAHAITWFEIPASDIDRAQRFYERVLGHAMQREQIGNSTLAVFAHADGGATGCLQRGDGVDPQGCCVYLDANPSLDAALARAEALGGRVVTPRTALPPGMVFFAHVVDCEGNRVGIHAAG